MSKKFTALSFTMALALAGMIWACCGCWVAVRRPSTRIALTTWPPTTARVLSLVEGNKADLH